MRKYVVREPVFASEIILMEGTPEDYKRTLNWKNNPDHEWTLNHECTHAMHFLFQYREIYYTMEKDELAAYYHSWIYIECLKRLRRK